MKMKKILVLTLSLFMSVQLLAQSTAFPFALNDVKLLPSRFQRNMQRDSAWIASIPLGYVYEDQRQDRKGCF